MDNTPNHAADVSQLYAADSSQRSRRLCYLPYYGRLHCWGDKPKSHRTGHLSERLSRLPYVGKPYQGPRLYAARPRTTAAPRLSQPLVCIDWKPTYNRTTNAPKSLSRPADFASRGSARAFYSSTASGVTMNAGLRAPTEIPCAHEQAARSKFGFKGRHSRRWEFRRGTSISQFCGTNRASAY